MARRIGTAPGVLLAAGGDVDVVPHGFAPFVPIFIITIVLRGLFVSKVDPGATTA